MTKHNTNQSQIDAEDVETNAYLDAYSQSVQKFLNHSYRQGFTTGFMWGLVLGIIIYRLLSLLIWHTPTSTTK